MLSFIFFSFLFFSVGSCCINYENCIVISSFEHLGFVGYIIVVVAFKK